MMNPDLVAYVLAVVIIGGHALEVLYGRDDWPFSAYKMYAYLVNDHVDNPYSPCVGKCAGYDCGFLVVSAIWPDGTTTILTTKTPSPMLQPFDRIGIVLAFTAKLRRSESLEQPLHELLLWIDHRAQLGNRRGPKSIALDVYLWRTVPEDACRNHPPDTTLRLNTASLAR